jgi:hypothetical protein
VGTVWLGLTGGAFLVGASGVGYVLGATFVLMALVTTLTNFCIPSLVYRLLGGRQDACPL